MLSDHISSVYLAPEKFCNHFAQESGLSSGQNPRLFFSDRPPQYFAWAEDIWLDPVIITFDSISDASRKLKSIAPLWVLYSVAQHRRAALIQQNLRTPRTVPMDFPAKKIPRGAGVWTLLDANTMLASVHAWKKYPLGKMEFLENKDVPPSRAYLKLWEALTLIESHPQKGETCLDLGSSPGGWTWVLQSLGAQVISVDKAPLASPIAKLPNINFISESAFALDPKKVGMIDWLCCDVACYPKRLYELIMKWLKSGNVGNMICTIKLQGKDDQEMIKLFKKIPDSLTLHLYNNKHELTWIYPFPHALAFYDFENKYT